MNESRTTTAKHSRRTHTASFKAQVVLEAMENKHCLEEIARQHDLHPNQIKNWKCTLKKRIGEIFEDRRQIRSRKNSRFQPVRQAVNK